MKNIVLDLYDLYKERMGVKSWIALPATADIFYIYIRIALACDVVHDFIEPRGPAGDALWKKYLAPPKGSSHLTNSEVKEKFEEYREHFRRANAKRIIEDCGHLRADDGTSLLDQIITGVPFEAQGDDITKRLISLFNNEKQAKKTIDNIHISLGIIEQNTLETIVTANKCSNFSVLDLMKAFIPDRKQSFTDYNITIDTTSDKTNLTPFISELMNRLHKTKNNCINLSSSIKVINSYATDYDASNENALSKVFKSLELTEDIEDNLNFNITCGHHRVFSGMLLKDNSGTISLRISKYFKKDFVEPFQSSSDGKDSVNDTTEKMLRSYKNTPRNPEELFNLTILKTMGDFLQIMTHLYLVKEAKESPSSVNVFISFDIICAKIAGLFDRGVFYEKKFTSEQDKLSGGLYTFYTASQYESALKALQTARAARPALHGGEKRQRTDALPFGKKKPKVKNVPNKAIMTKLKSVGIKITKKQGKRRVYLSRPELIKRATAFKNLQNRAKKLKVRIMYKNKKGKYVYKTAKRLMNDIKRRKRMKKPVKKQMKKPVKKSNVKQMKQRFG